MTKLLKNMLAFMLVFSGSISLSKFVTQPVSYSSVLYGVVGILILYPTFTGYLKMLDNLFDE
jgi:hypothetical protein